MNDRTTKTLLFLIVAALWGILLRPFVSLPPARAQTNRSAAPQQTPAITSTISASGSTERVYVVANGKISMWEPIYVLSNQKGKKPGSAFRLRLMDVRRLP